MPAVCLLSIHFSDVLYFLSFSCPLNGYLHIDVPSEWYQVSQISYLFEFICAMVEMFFSTIFLYARLKNRRNMQWQCRSVCPSTRLSVGPSFHPSVRVSGLFSTCFEITIWNLVYTFSRWNDMSSLSFVTIRLLWSGLQSKAGEPYFLQSWPH